MNALSFAFEDIVWLSVLEFLVAAVFLWAVFNDIRTSRVNRAVGAGKRSGAIGKVVRGERSWAVLLSFWALAIILVQIVISSDLIADYRVIVGMANVAALVYLNLFSGFFRNRIIVWSNALRNRAE